MAETQTFSARAVAGIISAKMRGVRAYDARDVRGLARGDNGAAVLSRFAESNADGSNRSHQYTTGEVRLLLEAVAARHAKRTGTTVRVPAPFATARTTAPKARKSTKRTGTRKATPKAASVTPSAPSES